MNSYEIRKKLKSIYDHPDYYRNSGKNKRLVCITKVKEELLAPYLKSRRRANKKYYSKEENKEAKRQYMKDYIKRPYVKAKIKKRYKDRKDWWKAYYQRPHVKAKMKAYAKKYNKRPKVKIARHEWYINKLIKENDKLHAENSNRFTNYFR